MNTQRKIALGIAGAIVAGSTFGLVATSFAEDTAPTPGATQQGGFGFGRMADMAGRGRMGGPMGQMGQMARGAGYGAQDQVAVLAEKLGGVDKDALAKALTDYRADHVATVRGRDMDDAARTAEHKALAKYLAEKLGVDETKALEALEGMDEARQATRTAEITARLEAAVKDGRLTQAQADAMKAAHESGAMGAMGGFGRGRR